MQIFYLINGLAGQYPVIDALMRFVYVAAVPVMATVLAAWILLTPNAWMHPKAPSRGRLLLATVVALFFGVLSIGSIAAFQYVALGGKVLSHRPFLTHFVTSLVMEPNNNSFPCFEMMFAASLATLMWAGRPRLGVCGWVVAAVLGIARLYCGTNFTTDVIIGAIWGVAIAGTALSICGVSLTFPVTVKTRLRWRTQFQGAASLLLFVVTLIYVTGWMASTPHHLPPLFALLHGGRSATAAPMDSPKSTFIHEPSSNDSGRTREMLLLTDAVKQDGHLPRVEKYLLAVLNQPDESVLGVNVAEVRSGKTAYRCAAIRFSVHGQGNAERKRVTAEAARLVKKAFHADSRIDHIDILGMKHLENSKLYTEGGTPVFTASIDREDLILSGDRTWLNAANTDPGLWLRARSLLYFNPQILPSDEVFPVKEFLSK